MHLHLFELLLAGFPLFFFPFCLPKTSDAEPAAGAIIALFAAPGRTAHTAACVLTSIGGARTRQLMPGRRANKHRISVSVVTTLPWRDVTIWADNTKSVSAAAAACQCDFEPNS